MSLDARNLAVKQRNLLYSIYLLNRQNAYLDATSLQKFIFLITKSFPSDFKDYNVDYEPFDFGPYSEEVENDAARLQTLGLLDDELKVPPRNSELIAQIKESNVPLMTSLADYVDAIARLSKDDLLYIVYNLYPEYTKRSKITQSVSSRNYESSTIDLKKLEENKEIFIETDKKTKLTVRFEDGKITILLLTTKDAESNE